MQTRLLAFMSECMKFKSTLWFLTVVHKQKKQWILNTELVYKSIVMQNTGTDFEDNSWKVFFYDCGFISIKHISL